MRALLLKEDAAVRLGTEPETEHAAFKPKLDRTLRLRAIRRLQTQKQAEITTAEKRAAALDESLPRSARASKAARAKAAAAAAAASLNPGGVGLAAKPRAAPAKPAKSAKPVKPLAK
jgi:hypothetical protein